LGVTTVNVIFFFIFFRKAIESGKGRQLIKLRQCK
jgi:hypothetical protein